MNEMWKYVMYLLMGISLIYRAKTVKGFFGVTLKILGGLLIALSAFSIIMNII